MQISSGLLLVCPGSAELVVAVVGGSAHPPGCLCACAENVSVSANMSEPVATKIATHYLSSANSLLIYQGKIQI